MKRPELVLAAAVAICLPMVPGILSGNVTVVTAGLRFLIAILLCWMGGSVLGAVLDRYAAEARRNQALKMLAATRRPTAREEGPGALGGGFRSDGGGP